jgi:hypothetical protein
MMAALVSQTWAFACVAAMRPSSRECDCAALEKLPTAADGSDFPPMYSAKRPSDTTDILSSAPMQKRTMHLLISSSSDQELQGVIGLAILEWPKPRPPFRNFRVLSATSGRRARMRDCALDSLSLEEGCWSEGVFPSKRQLEFADLQPLAYKADPWH